MTGAEGRAAPSRGRLVVRVVSVGAVALSAAWFVSNPDYEPAITFLAGLAGLLGSIFLRPKEREELHPKWKIPTTICSRFAQFLAGLEKVASSEFRQRVATASVADEAPPEIIDEQLQPQLLAWVEGLDDELLLVTLAMVRMKGRKRHLQGTTLRALTSESHPLGRGRKVEELIEALLHSGVLGPSTEEIPSGTYHEIDSKANPAWDFGEMFFRIRYYLELADRKGILKVSDRLPGGSALGQAPR